MVASVEPIPSHQTLHYIRFSRRMLLLYGYAYALSGNSPKYPRTGSVCPCLQTLLSSPWLCPCKSCLLPPPPPASVTGPLPPL